MWSCYRVCLCVLGYRREEDCGFRLHLEQVSPRTWYSTLRTIHVLLSQNNKQKQRDEKESLKDIRHLAHPWGYICQFLLPPPPKVYCPQPSTGGARFPDSLERGFSLVSFLLKTDLFNRYAWASSMCQLQGPAGESNPWWWLCPQNWRPAMQTGVNPTLREGPGSWVARASITRWMKSARACQALTEDGHPPFGKGRSWLWPLLRLPIGSSICLKFYSF